MGLELDCSTSRSHFNARCDGCDTFMELSATRAQTAQVTLRNCGWRRSDYIIAAKHYTWLCPKCKVENELK